MQSRIPQLHRDVSESGGKMGGRKRGEGGKEIERGGGREERRWMENVKEGGIQTGFSVGCV